MVNYYAILDAFPQMSQQDLLESYSNIVSCVGLVYGRHRVDEALVSHLTTILLVFDISWDQ